ncbi:polysaccharide pyruvyl transferase family protein [Aquihabitans sp. G128]|nr:polysaccharide pyruvyl transferase family protein [Aquihabitans sp. G128]
MAATAKAALDHLSGLGVRERWGSVPTLAALGVAADRWAVTGDDALQVAIDAPRSASARRGLGVSLRANRASAAPERLPELVAGAIGAALPGTPLELLTMMESASVSDRALLERVRPAGEPERSTSELDVPAALAAIDRCRLVVTGTYHAAVFALGLGIPVIGLAGSDYYRQKLHGALEEFGPSAGVVLDARSPLLADELADALRTWWGRAPEVGPELEAAARRQAGAAAAYFADHA